MKLFKKYFAGRKNNFLFFVMSAFVFIASTAFAVSDQPFFNIPSDLAISYEPKTFPKIPILGDDTSYPTLSAQGVYAIDLDSGITLYEKNADAPLLPASTTKIITALVALDSFQLDSVLTVTDGGKVTGQKMGLYRGESIRFEDLLYGLLVYSANDAAMTIADNYCTRSKFGVAETCGYDAFVKAMNTKAMELSMVNSHFDNPVGLDGNSHRSTAKDLVRVSEVAMRNPTFAKVVGTGEVTVSDVSGKSIYNLKNLNKLLGEIPGVIGVKTGWTESARENLVTYIHNDHKIMIAILGSTDRFGETKELIDWIYRSYDWNEVAYP